MEDSHGDKTEQCPQHIYSRECLSCTEEEEPYHSPKAETPMSFCLPSFRKLKTVTEIRRSSARDTFIAEIVYLVLNSLLDLGASGEIEREV